MGIVGRKVIMEIPDQNALAAARQCVRVARETAAEGNIPNAILNFHQSLKTFHQVLSNVHAAARFRDSEDERALAEELRATADQFRRMLISLPRSNKTAQAVSEFVEQLGQDRAPNAYLHWYLQQGSTNTVGDAIIDILEDQGQ